MLEFPMFNIIDYWKYRKMYLIFFILFEICFLLECCLDFYINGYPVLVFLEMLFLGLEIPLVAYEERYKNIIDTFTKK